MLGLIQLALLALFVAFACGSETCSWPNDHQPAGVGLFQQSQRRHTAASPAAGPSIPSTFPTARHTAASLHVQPAHVDVILIPEPTFSPEQLQGAPVSSLQSAQSPPVAPQRAAAQLPSAAAQPPDVATTGLIASVSQVTQQEAGSAMKSLADTTKSEVNLNREMTLLPSNTSMNKNQKVSLLVDQRAKLTTNASIMTDLPAQAPKKPKEFDLWSKKTLLDGACVVGALVIMFLFLVLADVI